MSQQSQQSQNNVIQARVAEIRPVSETTKQFTLVAAHPDSGPRASLPAFSSGSHVTLHLQEEERTYRNPYSLVNSPPSTDYYEIAVRREEDSRGGSILLHETVDVGTVLQLEPPQNFFSLDVTGYRHVLIADEIGITASLSHARRLLGLGLPFELHYVFASAKHAPFYEELRANRDVRACLHPEGRDVVLNEGALTEILIRQPVGSHLYVCGPQPHFAEAVVTAARENGWSERRLHSEVFKASDRASSPFGAMLARSGKEIIISEEFTLLEELENQGFDIPNMCRMGVCGECETGLLDGEPDHRDSYLTQEEKSSKEKIMPCVSRACEDKLVLDL